MGLHEEPSRWHGFTVGLLVDLAKHFPDVNSIITTASRDNHHKHGSDGEPLRVLRVGSPEYELVVRALQRDALASGEPWGYHKTDGGRR